METVTPLLFMGTCSLLAGPEWDSVIEIDNLLCKAANGFSAKMFLGGNAPKFSTAKVLCYKMYVYTGSLSTLY